MIKDAERLLLHIQSLEAPGTSKREGLWCINYGSIVSSFYCKWLFPGRGISFNRFEAEGFPLTDLKQLSEIVKRLEAKIEKQGAKIVRHDAVINELHSKDERMETEANRTEEVRMALRDTELLSATGDKAVRDLP